MIGAENIEIPSTIFWDTYFANSFNFTGCQFQFHLYNCQFISKQCRICKQFVEEGENFAHAI